MKTSLFSFLLLSPLSAVAHQNDEATRPKLRRRTQDIGNVNHRESMQACVVALSNKRFELGEEEYMECELQGVDLLDGESFRMVNVQGLPHGWAEENGIESGFSTIFAQDSYIDDDTNALIINAEAGVEIGNSAVGTIAHTELANVVKKVLVLRVVAQDSKTTATETQLADDIFGASGDAVNLQSQYKACSYDQLQFNAVTSITEGGTDGVYTVYLDTTNVKGASDGTIRTKAVNAATAQLGRLTNIADYVMVCLPPGTNGGWIAYAYINHWLSVYNDKWCQYPSAQMHEMGHNLNLAHAGESTSTYGDQSGMMGYSYGQDETPRMCFNGPKSWQLGWYSDYHVDLSTNNYNWSGDLVGFAEKSATAASYKMIIRIRNDFANTDTYVHFNRKIGFNSETLEGGNQVLVGYRKSGVGYGSSTLAAKLNANGVYTINNIGGTQGSVRITVNSINTSSTPARANISIQLVGQPTLAPTPTPTPVPTTAAPTPTPTPAPVPTSSPSPTRINEPPSTEVCQNFAVYAEGALAFAANTISSGNVGAKGGITGLSTLLDGEIVDDFSTFAAETVARHTALMAVRADGKAIAGNIGGRTFTPGTYRSDSAITIGATMFLDGKGDANSVFLFQALSMATTASTKIVLTNGAKAENVLWVLSASSAHGATSVFEGSILAGAAITFGAGHVLNGCAISLAAISFGAGASVEPKLVSKYTSTPVVPPTAAPVIPPTAAPIVPPTAAPVVPPTAAPVVPPTAAPVVSPTAAPVVSPTAAPVVPPTAAPVVPPTAAPVVPPTAAPVVSPTAAPVVPPTAAPVVPITSLSSEVCQNFAVHAGAALTFAANTIKSGDVGAGAAITGLSTLSDGEIVDDSIVFAAETVARHTALMAVRADGKAMSGNIGGKTFTPGTYRSDSAITIGATMFLDGKGDANSVFLFQALSMATTASTKIVLTNGAKAENVLWVLSASSAHGATSVFEGSILAGAAITFGAGFTLHGCAISLAAITFGAGGYIEPLH